MPEGEEGASVGADSGAAAARAGSSVRFFSLPPFRALAVVGGAIPHGDATPPDFWREPQERVSAPTACALPVPRGRDRAQ